MITNRTILRVAVRSPLRKVFDYLSPLGLESPWQPGQRLKVPFGSREVIGILLGSSEHTDVPADKLKSVIEVLDPASLLPDTLMALFGWASDYYLHPIGDVILGNLPKLLRQGRSPIGNATPPLSATPEAHLDLNAQQQQAVDAIQAAPAFQTFCLQGVTGSGKTEVYLQSMAPRLAAGQQVLVMVPEIALTPQTLARFEARFSVPVVCWHSELTDKQRLVAWSQAASGHAKIVIGTRSAVFLPMQQLGMIILDEAHDPSFKQQSGFRYSARDVAIVRARLEKVPVILGSATPSLETLENVSRQRYQHLVLSERAGASEPPKMAVVDLRGLPLNAGLSIPLIDRIQAHLDQQGQVLLFLNRRGYAPTLLCHHCGWMSVCPRCDARMTLHKNPARLYCHHCGRQGCAPTVCQSCHQADLSDLGVGTEQLESALSQLFPNEKVIRIDRDSTRKKGSLTALLDQIHSGEARLLIGTQMLSKGHHFKNLSLVGVVDADGGLYGTDFRAMERMAQLIVQVSGRAGRESTRGEVIIQTHHPDNHLLQRLLNQGYTAFTEALGKERKIAQLPPFSYLALLRAEAIQQVHPMAFLKAIKQATSVEGVKMMGPIPAPMERRAGRYRAQLLLESPDRAALHVQARQIVQRCQDHPLSRKVRWSIDVDPQEML